MNKVYRIVGDFSVVYPPNCKEDELPVAQYKEVLFPQRVAGGVSISTMNRQAVKVSIGLPVYNGERYLAKALDSLLVQTFTDFEVIISDNASTDRTAEICAAYLECDPRIRYYRNEQNIGAAPNFNRTFELATGMYFKWAAADDMLAPTFLEKCVAVLDTDSSVVVAYPWTQYIDAHGNNLAGSPHNGKHRADSTRVAARFHDLINYDHYCHQVFGVIRVSVLRNTGLIRSYSEGDRLLLAELGLMGRFCEIPEYLFLNRSHPDQSSVSLGQKSNRLIYTAWFNPANAGQLQLPTWQLYQDYFQAVHRIELHWFEKIGCYLCLLWWILRYSQLKKMLKDIIIVLPLIFRRTMHSLHSIGRHKKFS